MTKDADPTREVARIALTPTRNYDSDTLREIIKYAFGQLCWGMTDAQLVALILELAQGDLRIALAQELGGV